MKDVAYAISLVALGMSLCGLWRLIAKHDERPDYRMVSLVDGNHKELWRIEKKTWYGYMPQDVWILVEGSMYGSSVPQSTFDSKEEAEKHFDKLVRDSRSVKKVTTGVVKTSSEVKP